jgi:hypothetical protein
METAEERKKRPNCLACAHFRVTWEPAFPRACNVFGFKTRNLPSVEVYAATGRICPAYEKRAGIKEKVPGGSGSL